MSQSNDIWSRRQIIKATASLPLVALACRALAEPTEENRTAMMAAAEDIPAPELKDILDDAQGRFSVDRGSYETIALLLWNYFLHGVEQEGGCDVEIPEANKVATALYGKAGKPLADNLNNNEFPPDLKDVETNVCAFMCGQKAAQLAMQTAKPWKMTADNAREAWAFVKQNRRRCFTRASEMRKRRGEAEPARPNIGLGC